MLKQNLGWVTGKTEPKECSENWINRKFASLDSKCRKITTHNCPCTNVEMLKRNLGWVMGKTEPKESSENWINGKFASLVSKCRKVTMHVCPCINVLNIEIEPRMGERENWTKGKFRKLNKWKIYNSVL